MDAAPWAPAAGAAALVALCVRAAVALHPHSGAGRPPMHGDLECQRHWMELAVHLPVGEWYRNTSRNDLQYWGPDYPPLTLAAAWALGRVAAAVAPGAVAWEASRGDESPATLLLMRGGTLAFDALSMVPAAIAYFGWLQPRAAPLRGLLLLLLQPALVLVDHGHYQWNCLCLGLTLAAVVALGRGRWLAGAAAFAAALNVKQMALYYSPAFFVLLLAVCGRGGTRAVLGCGGRASAAAPTRPSPLDAAAAVAAVGLSVAAVFAVVWAPFCVWAQPGVGCAAGLQGVLARLFPLDRSLFEDKVSNLWCAAEPLLRLRARLYAGGGARLRGRVAAASAAATACLMLPALCALWLRLWRMPRAAMLCTPGSGAATGGAAGGGGGGASVDELGGAGGSAQGSSRGVQRAVGDSSGAAAGGAHTDALLPRPGAQQQQQHQAPPVLAAACRAAEAPIAPASNSSCSSVNTPAAPAARRRRAPDAQATATAAAAAAPVAAAHISSPALRAAAPAAAACDGKAAAGASTAEAPSALSPPPPATATTLSTWVAWELLLAALAACALAFFAASYQVHEKSILLPLLPLAALQHRLPLLAAWFAAVATWSMWPLLRADALLAPAACLSLVHVLLAWPSLAEAAAHEGAVAAAVLRGGVQPRAAARALRALAAGSLVPLAALPLAAALVPPPPRLPDLWPYLSAVYVAGLLLATLAALSALLLAAAREPAGGAAGLGPSAGAAVEARTAAAALHGPDRPVRCTTRVA